MLSDYWLERFIDLLYEALDSAPNGMTRDALVAQLLKTKDIAEMVDEKVAEALYCMKEHNNDVAVVDNLYKLID